MRNKGAVGLLAVLLANTLFAGSLFAAPTLHHLKPGEVETLEQKVPINIVLVGFQDGGDAEEDDQDDAPQVFAEAILNELPQTYTPAVRAPLYYGLTGRDMGLRHVFEYKVTHADKLFADRLFSYLRWAGKPGDLTEYQQLYNDQENNIRDVTGPVMYIDAPSVERWLIKNGEYDGYGQGYTVYFINWYGRKNFKFHVYQKTDDPDPDTGFNFGRERQDRKFIAWGGSHGRTWFYDFSAGPEAWSRNWNVDDVDVFEGDGDDDEAEDYRIPPIWEYDEEGYRAPTALSTDMGYLTRFVAINLLFTTSPLYDPLVTTPGRGGAKVVDTTIFEDNPELSGLALFDAKEVRDELRDFQPYYRWRVPVRQVDPIDPETARSLRIAAGVLEEPGCWEPFGTPFAQLYCHLTENLDQYVAPAGPKDYVGPHFAFATTDEVRAGLGLGYADDNWVDGTQSYLYSWISPSGRERGYGLTVTAIHEFGHHIGMSHPHDGYDSELGVDYFPADFFNFVWSGDESATVMSYLDVNFSFGRFDRDNMYRWETAGYLNLANDLLDDILASPDAGRVEARIRKADWLAGQAKREFRRWRFDRSVRRAYDAYLTLVDAARIVGVDPDAPVEALRLQYQSVPKVIDPIR